MSGTAYRLPENFHSQIPRDESMKKEKPNQKIIGNTMETLHYILTKQIGVAFVCASVVTAAAVSLNAPVTQVHGESQGVQKQSIKKNALVFGIVFFLVFVAPEIVKLWKKTRYTLQKLSNEQLKS